MSERRDFNDPAYKRWRKKVYGRDKFTCKMPDCSHTDKRLNAHHIKKWASFPSLRYVLSNGITLCRTCHERIHGVEEDYESLFSKIVNRPDSDIAIQLMMMRYGKKPEDPK